MFSLGKQGSKSLNLTILWRQNKKEKKKKNIYTHTDTPTPNVLPLLKILLYITLLVEIIRVELFFLIVYNIRPRIIKMNSPSFCRLTDVS